MQSDTTIAAIATPPGVGGIAVVRVSGPEAYSVATKVFIPKNAEKNLHKMSGYSAAFGSFQYRGSTIDEGVALCFRNPHSYTGEDVVELSCHGGTAVSSQVLAACLEAGASPAGPGEFTKRAVLNGRMDLTQAEAVFQLINATSRQGVQLAKAGLEGKLYKTIAEVRGELTTLAGHLAAWVDYPEEDVEELTQQQFLHTVQNTRKILNKWIKNYDKGVLLQRGVQTAIVGSPNVGKSTLFNLLSGCERAIVTPVAGTTRDVLREQVQLDGIALLLSDTAGLHETADLVEAEGIRRSRAELEGAGLVLVVFDGSKQPTAEELALAKECKGVPSLGIINKSDLGVKLNPETLAPYFTKTIVLSALEPTALHALEQAILSVLRLQNFDADAALLTTQRQVYAAREAENALKDAENALFSGLSFDAAGVCLEEALQALADIVGENSTDDVINNVFTKFCVGK